MPDLVATSGLSTPTGGMWSMGGPMWMPSQPPTLARLLAVHLQPVPVLPVLALVGLVGYLAAIARLARSGQSWPLHRTLAWILGAAVTELATATGIEGYGMMIFSVHMAQHMVLAMIVPILLAVGAPVRLARMTLRGGARSALDRVTGSRVADVLLSVPVRWTLFLASLYGIYFTPAFGALMHTVWGHTVMLIHFLVTGCLFFGPLIAPRRASSAGRRIVATFAAAPVHAVFGLVILLAQHPVVHFFDRPVGGWGIGVLSDQSLAGAIAWSTSEAATVLAMVVIATQRIARPPTPASDLLSTVCRVGVSSARLPSYSPKET